MRLCFLFDSEQTADGVLSYAKHKRALLAEAKSTAYGDLDAQAFLSILAVVSC